MIGFLGVLEVILSVDNALVLAILASQLPKEQQKKALTYGMAGAFFFRVVAIAAANYLIHLNWIKFVGGGYLVWLAMKNLIAGHESDNEDKVKPASPQFWKAVMMIQFTDIAFAVDSILAAVAISNQFWIIVCGGFIGIVMIRFAATGFMKLLEKFPRFNQAAYLLVLTIGIKVILEGFHIPGLDFHTVGSPAFLGFWIMMMTCFLYGFSGKSK
ncbi:MAG: hypothetical protein KA715_00990 [Xanthomonadaceae bacterium]|nr:hypothetical protein [Xanthomonadaceae bacterium]